MELNKNFDDIIQMILQARQDSILAVNKELIKLYWNVGKYVHNKIKDEGWGKSVVTSLADFIKEKDHTIKGFSAQNLWRMKQFFETYSENSELSALTREVSWTNNMIILSKAKTDLEREFYINLVIKERYSSRELERQIDAGIYERVLLSESNLSAALRELHPKSKEVFKDNYILDFLALPKPFAEKDLRISIVDHFKDFETKLIGKELLERKLHEFFELADRKEC